MISLFYLIALNIGVITGGDAPNSSANLDTLTSTETPTYGGFGDIDFDN